ncbi:amidohydrolase family protein, partial [bacterium]|nr:amidohydrolase family protein [bacterium]
MLVKNGTVVCPDRIIADGAVYIENGIIADIGEKSTFEKKYKDDHVDACGGLIMPGLINTHMHFYSTFARGMSLDGKSATNFVEILEKLWWRLDKKLTEEDIYYSALIPLIESVKCGTTTIIDHHASPFAVEGSLELLAKAVEEIGLRASLCYEISDRDGKEIADSGIAENVRFIKEHKGSDVLSGLMGLHASFTISDETLEKAVSEASSLNVGCHVHVAEDKADLDDSKSKYEMGVVERLNSRGVLGPNTIAGHCIHISDKEIDLLADTKTNVVHNPESNMNNAVGCARVIDMFKKNVLVG